MDGGHQWIERVRALYDSVDEEMAADAHLCTRRGLCCDFPRSGLHLYATRLEVNFLLAGTPVVPEVGGSLCPFWRGGLCHARDARPLGCRTYFCDPTLREKGEELYARAHRALISIGEELRIPYEYRPWVDSLRRAAKKRRRGRGGDRSPAAD